MHVSSTNVKLLFHQPFFLKAGNVSRENDARSASLSHAFYAAPPTSYYLDWGSEVGKKGKDKILNNHLQSVVRQWLLVEANVRSGFYYGPLGFFGKSLLVVFHPQPLWLSSAPVSGRTLRTSVSSLSCQRSGPLLQSSLIIALGNNNFTKDRF